MEIVKVSKVLLIDDSLYLRNMVGMLLTTAGYRVEKAENGHIGLQMLRQKDYDAIVSDVLMPGMSGLSLYKSIKEELPNVKNKVLFLTADRTKETLSFFRENDCRYVAKPFKSVELLAHVESILSME